MASHPPASPSMEAARTAALQVLAGGALGGSWGALSAYLKGQPVGFFLSAYGVNAAVLTAAFLGTRSLLASAVVAPRAAFASEEAWSTATASARAACSAAAGAVSGGVMTGFVGGPRQALVGAALWSAVAWGGHTALEAVGAWRAEQASQLAVRDALWDALSPEARATFRAHSHGAPPPTAGSPPPLSALPALVAHARAHGLQAVTTPGSAPPPPPPTPANGERGSGAWDWLPIHFHDSHELRLARLRKRLGEIEEVLGLPPSPASMPSSPPPSPPASRTLA